MDEIRQNREVAKDEHQKSQIVYNHNQEPAFDSEVTNNIERRPLHLDSSMSTNRANVAPFWNPTHSQSPPQRAAIPELKDDDGTFDETGIHDGRGAS